MKQESIRILDAIPAPPESFDSTVESALLRAKRKGRVTVASVGGRRITLPKRAIVALVAAAVLLIASTALAATVWTARERYSPDTYLMQAEQRQGESAIPDIEQTIAEAAPVTESYRLIPVTELDIWPQLKNLREQEGKKAYDPAEWAWLESIVPTVGDVLLDGDFLQWQTVLTSDHPERFDGGRTLDAVPYEAYWSREGESERHPLGGGSGGIIDETPQPVHETEVEPDASFPTEGRVTVIEQIELLDCTVDPQGDLAMVALIEHTFTIDAGAGSAAFAPRERTLPLSGEAIVTVMDGEHFYNKRKSLDGLTLNAVTEYRATGLYLTLTSDGASGWTETELKSLLSPCYLNYEPCGLYAEYTVNGETYRAEATGIDGGVRFVLPIFPSEYETVGDVTVALSLWHIVSSDGQTARADWSWDFANGTYATSAGEGVPIASLAIEWP